MTSKRHLILSSAVMVIAFLLGCLVPLQVQAGKLSDYIEQLENECSDKLEGSLKDCQQLESNLIKKTKGDTLEKKDKKKVEDCYFKALADHDDCTNPDTIKKQAKKLKLKDKKISKLTKKKEKQEDKCIKEAKKYMEGVCGNVMKDAYDGCMEHATGGLNRCIRGVRKSYQGKVRVLEKELGGK